MATPDRTYRYIREVNHGQWSLCEPNGNVTAVLPNKKAARRALLIADGKAARPETGETR